MKEIINNVVMNIDVDEYDYNFFVFVQNFFCYKYDLDKTAYNELLSNLELNNEFVELERSEFKKELKEYELKELVSNYDSYLDKSIREKTGSFYTPKELSLAMSKRALADYLIVNNVLDKINCEELIFNKNNQLTKEEEVKVERVIKEIDIIDISCGTGSFLISVIEVLVEVLKTLSKDFEIRSIVKNIYAADIQGRALEIYALIIFDYLLEYGLELSEIPSLNILCTDSLLEEQLFDKTFDIVIGNPPYVGEKGNKELFSIYRESLPEYYEGKMDLFYFFIYKGLELLKDDGIFSYLTSNYFVTADGASKLRKYLRENVSFVRLINFDECKLFKEAKGMHNLIFTLSKKNIESAKIQYIDKSNKEFRKEDIYYEKYLTAKEMLFSEDDNIVIYESVSYFNIIDKILSKSDFRLGEISKINQGIVSGGDRVSNLMLTKKLSIEIINTENIKKDDGIYVFDKDESINSEFEKPFYKNSDINKYFVKKESQRKILYLTDNTLVDDDSLGLNHLRKYYEVLCQRREVKKGTKKWFSLQWPRVQSIFEGEKIVVPQRAMENIFAYSSGEFYASADVYYITKSQKPLKYLLAILNSKLIYFWLYNRGKRKGKSLELYAKPLSQIPIPQMEKELEKKIIDIVDNIFDLEKLDRKSLHSIDELIFKYYNITDEEKQLIEGMK